MPVIGAMVAKFHPLSYGDFIRFAFVLATVSKVIGYRICFTKVIWFLFVSFKAKYCCGPGSGGENDHEVEEVTSSPTRLPEL